MRAFPLLALLSLGTLAACHDKTEAAPGNVAQAPAAAPVVAGTSVESVTFAPALGIDLKASTKTASGLYYRDLKVGTGPLAISGETVTAHYVGYLPDGTLFEEGVLGAPGVTLGAGRVIAGLDEGIVGMKVGGKRQLIIPSDLGYGATGSPPKIAPNMVLVFNIDLLSAH